MDAIIGSGLEVLPQILADGIYGAWFDVLLPQERGDPLDERGWVTFEAVLRHALHVNHRKQCVYCCENSDMMITKNMDRQIKGMAMMKPATT